MKVVGEGKRKRKVKYVGREPSWAFSSADDTSSWLLSIIIRTPLSRGGGWNIIQRRELWNEREEGKRWIASRNGNGDGGRKERDGYRRWDEAFLLRVPLFRQGSYLPFFPPPPSPHVVYFRGGGLRYRPNHFVIHWSTSRRAVEPSLPANRGWNISSSNLINETIWNIGFSFFKIANPNFLVSWFFYYKENNPNQLTSEFDERVRRSAFHWKFPWRWFLFISVSSIYKIALSILSKKKKRRKTRHYFVKLSNSCIENCPGE